MDIIWKDKPIGGGRCLEMSIRIQRVLFIKIGFFELKQLGVNDSSGFDFHSFRKTERITMVGLLALEARGCRFESCLSDKIVESR